MLKKIVSSLPHTLILGVDPGTNILGFSLLDVQGDNYKLVVMDVMNLKSISDPYRKLQTIYTRLQQTIREYQPDELAIEAPFFGKNVQSMLKLGRAQGVAITVAIMNEIPVFEYSPKKIKQSITGNGNASKEQVAAMIGRILAIKEQHEFFDATDSMAVALCHHFQKGKPVSKGKSYSGWKDFITENPERVKK